MPSTLVLRNMVISDMKIPLDSWQTNNPAHPGQLADANGWWGSNAKYPTWNKGMGGSICLGARMFARVILAHVRFVANEIRTQDVDGDGAGTIKNGSEGGPVDHLFLNLGMRIQTYVLSAFETEDRQTIVTVT